MSHKYCFFVLLLLSLISFREGYGQKYKDVYPQIVSANDNHALALLKKYIIYDLDHPNANLLLAMIYDKRYREADVLTEHEKAIANAERAKLHFLKARLLINEKEVKKNIGYYTRFATGMDSKGRPIVEYATVNDVMVSKYDSIILFLKKTPDIYNTFVNAVNSYDLAIKAFYKITSTYNSLDDLYLLYDDKLKNDLSWLKQSYDSTIYYLETYGSKIKDYPIRGYSQQYNSTPIETYRLSGLIAQSDFLTNTIDIWNYGKWVDDVNEVMESEISKLRTGINDYENALNQALRRAVNTAGFSSFEPMSLNKELLFNLKKFDNQSLLASIFQYKHGQQFVRNRALNMRYYDTAKNVEPIIKYMYLGEMINACYILDSTLNEVKYRLTESNVKKHAQFMAVNYKGYKGVKAYVNLEKKKHSKAIL